MNFKKFEIYGNPTLQQGGWERTGEGNAYIQYASTYNPNYDYRICTLDYIPQHHPNHITITGVANNELEASVLVLRSDNYIISTLGWQDNGTTFNIGSTYDKIGVMFRFKNGDEISPNHVSFGIVGDWNDIPCYIYTTATEVVENPLYSDGTAITSYTIKGNTVQNGTPTPDNPVDVNGVGVRTENLFDGSTSATNQRLSTSGTGTYAAQGYSVSSFIEIEPSTYYTLTIGETTYYNLYNENKQYIYGSATNTRIPDSYANARYIRFDFKTKNIPSVMLVKGSTAPSSYIPYGYKIPISSGGVTTNIYLGSTQTTRQIKKLVLDGTENWNYYGGGDDRVFYIDTVQDYAKIIANICICSHYPTNDNVNSAVLTHYGVSFYYGGAPYRLFIKDTSISDFSSLTQYLKAQYSAGTPVTVWYVLATPKTAAVNEPLMKIGDYADTLSNAASIPTTEGANTITVDTTVQPSEFTATWTGWHNATVKEKSRNLWNESYTGIMQDFIIYLPLNVGDGDYTLSSTATREGEAAVLFLLAGNVSTGATTVNNGVWNGQSRTVAAVDGYITIGYRKYLTANPENANTMLNTGSTALPYEPYWK